MLVNPKFWPFGGFFPFMLAYWGPCFLSFWPFGGLLSVYFGLLVALFLSFWPLEGSFPLTGLLGVYEATP